MRKHPVQLLSVAVLTAACFNAWGAGMIYKCKNQQGDMIYQKKPCDENVETLSTWEPKPEPVKKAIEPGKTTAEPLIANPGGNGHYFLDAEVDSHAITFIVDTGASQVSLPSAVAASANLFCNRDVSMNTANGIGSGCTTIINELKLGSFVFTKVSALIIPNLSQPLLGMNILQRFDIEQKNGQMRLTERKSPEE